MLLGLRQDFAITKLVRKLRINLQAALRRFRKFCCEIKAIRSIVDTTVKLAPFRIPTFSSRLVLSFLPLLKQESKRKEMSRERRYDVTLPW